MQATRVSLSVKLEILCGIYGWVEMDNALKERIYGGLTQFSLNMRQLRMEAHIKCWWYRRMFQTSKKINFWVVK